MAAQLTFGTVPSYYRELHDLLCEGQDDKFERDLFFGIASTTSLPSASLNQIWDLADQNKHGWLTREGFYKALALIALAQQGKPVTDKALETLVDSNLPKPSLADMNELKQLTVKIRREKSPNILGYSHSELIDLDRIEVELEPDKKGLILKHREYTISSRKHNTSVQRRYNDFVAFYDLLAARFPYRLIPKLPPKKVGATKEFIEERRRALRRFLLIVARHPVMGEDQLLSCFLSFKGSVKVFDDAATVSLIRSLLVTKIGLRFTSRLNDIGHKMKEQFRGIPDEFVTSPLAAKSKELVPPDTQANLPSSRELIRVIHRSISKLKDISDSIAQRSMGMAVDMQSFSRELGVLTTETPTANSWATGGNETWSQLRNGFRALTRPFATIAATAAAHAEKEEEGISDHLAYFLDLTTAYKDLIERHEKGVLRDHQMALHKMQQYKQRHMSATVQGREKDTMDQLEHRILEQEGAINTMENRNYFSLYCLQMETQLIHANMDILITMIKNLTEIQIRKHKELLGLWEDMKPPVETLVGPVSGLSPPLSPSHTGSPAFS